MLLFLFEAWAKIKEMKMIITHYWVSGFGWENTIFSPSDFETCEELGRDENGVYFIGINDKNAKHILKGYYEN